jgi:hypothetical protein
MSNQFALAGAQPQKQSRFAPIFTGRWYSGLWTNRSPLRDANTTRLSEKFYGPSGDALIDGSNVEITNRLTLTRRPGNSEYAEVDEPVDRFYSFHLFGLNEEKIRVMVDHPTSLHYIDESGNHNDVFNKSTGAGQSYMQSVGNSLYFGDGVDNKKWLQNLTQWASGAKWNTPTTPFLSTFLLDDANNIQQLTATVIPISTTQIASNVLTVTSSETLDVVLSTGLEVTFPSGMSASFLDGEVVTISSVSTNTFTATFNHANSGPTSETGKYAVVLAGGKPISGTVTPVWSTTVPSSSNYFQGGYTYDGTAQWTNRGNFVQNWGIQPPDSEITWTINSSRTAWQANTVYSIAQVTVDTNGNLQQITTAGKSGSAAPSWNTTPSGTTTDGTAIWTYIQTAASLVWQANTAYTPGHFLVATSSDGTPCLFECGPFTQPKLDSDVSAFLWNHTHSGPTVGAFDLAYPLSTGTAIANATGLKAMAFDIGANVSVNPVAWEIYDAAGKETGTTTPFSQTNDLNYVIETSINVPAAGQYTFTISHHDGMIWGIGGGATKVSGPDVISYAGDARTQSAVNGYPLMGGTNQPVSSGSSITDTFVINFPTSGSYGIEVNFAFWYHTGLTFNMLCNGNILASSGSRISGSTAPSWPDWSTAFAPNYPSVSEAAGNITWNNLGPVTDFVWRADANYTLPVTTIIDPNANIQAAYETGLTGTTIPSFGTSINDLTNDSPNLIWINEGPQGTPPAGTINALNGGWIYGIALVNTLDNTVSNCGPLTDATGNFIGADSVDLAPGSGLPTLTEIDPQVDYVAIFRSTDGQATPFLIPGTGNSFYTVKLSDYINNGYKDTTVDRGLNNLLEAPVLGQNTPPPTGAINLTYHLNRIFFSVGNIVYWTAGPDTPIGNGVNGVPPLNFDQFPSFVKRIVPTSMGALVFTVSDIYLITGQGTASNAIQAGIPFLFGIGLPSYNALSINGSIIGMFTTDNQFLILDPSSGVSYVGFPIGDRLRKNNGNVGTSWNANDVYVTWHSKGEDQAWYVADGQTGWYRLMTTPAPETGLTWSAFAQINDGTGCKAVQSIEVQPGQHELLIGPFTTGKILKRDLSINTDDGSAYSAYAVIGSAVLAQPGQVAQVSFITTDSVAIGTPLSLAVILDEALPYYTGSFETLANSVNDPPNFPTSTSILGQRFYFSELEQAAVCRHMQIKVSWVDEDSPNELLTLTVFGAYNIEL